MADDYYENTRKQIRDIRKRIEELRSKLSPAQPRAIPRTESLEKSIQDVGRAREKEKELDDIRKKLRGFK
jgi:cell division septum initiation protein DivIVA